MSGARVSGRRGSNLLRPVSLALLLTLAGCADLGLPIPEQTAPPAEAPSLTLWDISFEELDGWDGEDFADVLPALIRSCDAIDKKNPESPMGDDERMGTVADWQAICKDARIIRPGNQIEAKYFFESRFVVYRTGNNQDPEGLFTGYYEPEVLGRWGPEAEFQIPVYSRPEDLVSIDLGQHRAELKGTHLAGRIVDNKLIPYYSRAEINAGALRGDRKSVV